jgi:hypothetical protein
MKRGDKVWVLCDVVTAYKDQDFPYVDVEHDGTVFQAIKKHCRPEAEMLDGAELVAKCNKENEVQGE